MPQTKEIITKGLNFFVLSPPPTHTHTLILRWHCPWEPKSLGGTKNLPEFSFSRIFSDLSEYF